MDFRPLELADKSLFESHISDDINYENTFACIYSWSAAFDYEIAVLPSALILRISHYFDTVRTKNKSHDEYIEECASFCRQKGWAFSMKILEKDFINLCPQTKDKYKFTPLTGHYDYIYDAKDLAQYPGIKFQKKRNLLSQFLRKYKYEFVDYDRQKHYDAILEFHNQRANEMEKAAFKRALDNLESLDLYCGIIEIEGKIAAFSVSTKPRNGAVEIIFEKGDVDYKGIYAAIVKFTAQKHFENCSFINRQEDMDMENIRKSKLSYNPTMQIKKYEIEFKDEKNT
jgi:hypothetical protein